MAHNNLLDDDWVFSSCVFFDEQHATIKIELCKASDEEVVIPIYVSASDVPPEDPVGAGRGPEALVLELLTTFSYQVSPDTVRATPVRLPLQWNPVL